MEKEESRIFCYKRFSVQHNLSQKDFPAFSSRRQCGRLKSAGRMSSAHEESQETQQTSSQFSSNRANEPEWHALRQGSSLPGGNWQRIPFTRLGAGDEWKL